jgi:DNA-binding transcriptional MerR regulator
MSASQSMNINEASKACGLSPSVLRIWELRYGWPSPKRKSNGYRAYNQHQVQELRRIAELVKNGTPISALIIDGLPRWPADHSHKRIIAGLTKVHTLPKPRGVLEAKLQQELVENLERRHATHAMELLQRAFWSVRPDDEVLTALVPTLVALDELAQTDRILPEDAQLRRVVKERSAQLLRRYRTDSPSLWTVPATPNEVALATLAALILNQRGHSTQLWLEADRPTTAPYLLAGEHQENSCAKDDRRLAGRISALGSKEAASLVDLLATGPTLPTPVAPLSTN